MLVCDLKENFECMFLNGECNSSKHVISAWANKISYSVVEQFGTDKMMNQNFAIKKINQCQRKWIKEEKRREETPFAQKKTRKKTLCIFA